jgi:hypothetical protein
LLASVTSLVPLDQLGLRDLGCPMCPSYASLEALESLDADTAASMLSADSMSADLLGFAEEAGFGGVLGGVQAGYADGSGWVMALLSTESDAAAAVVTGSGALEGAFLIAYDPASGGLTLSDRQGHMLIDLVSGEVSSWDAHSSCRYWHCVSAGVSWLLADSIGAYLIVYGGCEACSRAGDDIVYALTAEITCPACLVMLAAVVTPSALASVIDCASDSCRWCTSSACGATDVTGRLCAWDSFDRSPTGADWVLLRLGLIRSKPHRCRLGTARNPIRLLLRRSG